MKFIDEVTITVKSGKGGAGASSFRREKFVPFGGPDGGDGGRGGSVIVIADRNKQTLLDFTFRPLWEAEDGNNGEGRRKEGLAGDDLTMTLPVGTEIFNAETGELVVDLAQDGQQFVLCKGGRGGKGNHFFKSPTNRAPQHAQPGEEGQHGTYRFSLKLMADVGLIGLPNAGKSTLISRISAARPKIADYPFTTLVPNLGVVQATGGRSYVVADVPGLIAGAHQGKGLGIQFLKHIERTKVLAHLIDPTTLDDKGEPVPPQASFDIINQELRSFSPELADRRQLVLLTKAETVQDQTWLEAQRARFQEQGHQCLIISSATGQNIDTLKEMLAIAAC